MTTGVFAQSLNKRVFVISFDLGSVGFLTLGVGDTAICLPRGRRQIQSLVSIYQ